MHFELGDADFLSFGPVSASGSELGVGAGSELGSGAGPDLGSGAGPELGVGAGSEEAGGGGGMHGGNLEFLSHMFTSFHCCTVPLHC